MPLDRRVTVMVTGRLLLENLDLTFRRIPRATDTDVCFESNNHRVFVENGSSSFVVSNDADFM